jgi:hypothetical protein
MVSKRVEEYIKDYTRGFSNELVYGGYHEWLTPENAIRAAEIAEEDCRKQIRTYSRKDIQNILSIAEDVRKDWLDHTPWDGTENWVFFDEVLKRFQKNREYGEV